MDTSDKLYSFVFRGLLTEEAIDKVGRKNRPILSQEAEEEISQRLCLNILNEDLVSRARKMSIVYTAIASFENTLRDFVAKKLLEEKGETWWNSCVTSNIRKRAESRKEEESKVKWHGARGEAIINYIDFGDLCLIIKNNWEYFEPHFITQEWIIQLTEALEKSRNIIMHSGELGLEDIERVGSNIRDWIRQVGA